MILQSYIEEYLIINGCLYFLLNCTALNFSKYFLYICFINYHNTIWSIFGFTHKICRCSLWVQTIRKFAYNIIILYVQLSVVSSIFISNSLHSFFKTHRFFRSYIFYIFLMSESNMCIGSGIADHYHFSSWRY